MIREDHCQLIPDRGLELCESSRFRAARFIVDPIIAPKNLKCNF